MVASTKVKFKLDDLRVEALKAVDDHIAITAEDLDQMSDADHWAELQAEWRARQEKKLSRIFSQLDTVDNDELALFLNALPGDQMPRPDGATIRALQTRLVDLRAKRLKITAKSTALVPDADGTISLTRTQLSEFFGL